MPADERQPHFVQTGDAPIFTGQGTGELRCRCGQSVLVRGYDPSNFLGIDLRCASCGAVTTTPGLSALNRPPEQVVPVDRDAAAPPAGSTIEAHQAYAGREELDRAMALFRPRGPESNRVTISDAFLDGIVADYDRLTNGALAGHLATVAVAEAAKPLTGYRPYPLSWAIRTLRAGIRDPDWSPIATSPASVATTLVGAFRYFLDSWSQHPLFPAMVATAADTGFSLHGMALFATAKCLADSGNRVGFLPPRDGSGRLRQFALAMGDGAPLTCAMDVFDRYAWPHGEDWQSGDLHQRVVDSLMASKGQINLRHPGMIVLSPGATREEMEQPLVDAIHGAFHSHGRRYRHVTAVSVILAKIRATQDRDTVRFGYSFYPVPNPRQSAVEVKVAEVPGATARR
jgi:hypothetical protein